MTAGLEASRWGQAPVELFLFADGASAWYLTSAETPIPHLGHTYAPAAIARSAIRHTQEEGSGSCTVTLPRTDPLVAHLVGYLPPRAVSVTILRLQRDDLQGDTLFVGEVASIEYEGSVVTLKCVSAEALLARSAPGLSYQSPCNWVLFGTGCGVSAESFRVDGTVASVSRTTLVVGAAAGQPDGWFRNGRVRSAAGEIRYVVGHTGGTLTITAPFDDLSVGDAVALYPGCEHTETDCRAKFDNLVHFLGFPRMPARNPFTGTV